jgi:hypothetical protein
LQQKSQNAKAESVFLQGLKIDAANPELNYVLAVLYVQSNQRNKAMAPISFLKNNYPTNPDYQQLFKAVGL